MRPTRQLRVRNRSRQVPTFGPLPATTPTTLGTRTAPTVTPTTTICTTRTLPCRLRIITRMELDTLINDYFGCRENKRRSTDSIHFELHWERDLARLERDFQNRVLVPFLYAFLAPRPRLREVIACLMQMKILQYHFDIKVRPLVEERLTDRTFNNRIGYGPDKAVERLMEDIRIVSRNYTRDCYIISRDIKAYFPSSDLQRSYDTYTKLIEENIQDPQERDDLLYILLRVNYAYPRHNAILRSPRAKWEEIIRSGKSVIFNNDPNRGACLGNQFWQVEKNFDLNEFDHFQVDTCGLHYIRFVDDMRWVVENKQAGLAHVALSEKILKEQYGYEMHPNKRACQHFSKGGEFIGTWWKYDRTYVGNRVVRHAEEAIRKWNRLASENALEHFLGSINSYLGMMKHKNAYAIIRNLVDLVSPKWGRYCEFNDARRCFEARPGYRHNEILERKYLFKINSSHVKKRTTQHPGSQAA